MAANIFGTRFVGHREPAWHGLGTVFDEPIDASEAARRAGLNFVIEKVPVTAEYCGQTLGTEYYALVREPTADDPRPVVLGGGLVSVEYEVLPNADLARILDPITQRWPVETCGALGHGERVFWVLDAGEYDVAGRDHVKKYLMLTNAEGQNESLSFVESDVRTVCQNTLIAAMAAATLHMRIPHRRGARLEAVDTLAAIEQMEAAMLRKNEDMDVLAQRFLAETEVRAVIGAAFPVPQKPLLLQESPLDLLSAQMSARRREQELQYEAAVSRQEGWRAAAQIVFEQFGDEQPAVGGTAWAAYNAVAEVADWGGSGKAEVVGRSAMFGSRAQTKARAWSAALRIARSSTE